MEKLIRPDASEIYINCTLSMGQKLKNSFTRVFEANPEF